MFGGKYTYSAEEVARLAKEAQRDLLRLQKPPPEEKRKNSLLQLLEKLLKVCGAIEIVLNVTGQEGSTLFKWCLALESIIIAARTGVKVWLWIKKNVIDRCKLPLPQ